MAYSGGGGAPTVFEMQTGMVDRGASISCLSQYPWEEEGRTFCLPRFYILGEMKSAAPRNAARRRRRRRRRRRLSRRLRRRLRQPLHGRALAKSSRSSSVAMLSLVKALVSATTSRWTA